jgi:hypothetical protein
MVSRSTKRNILGWGVVWNILFRVIWYNTTGTYDSLTFHKLLTIQPPLFGDKVGSLLGSDQIGSVGGG